MNPYRGFSRCLFHCVAALVCGLSGVCRADDPTIAFHFINVGQGAATLIEAKCGLVLIDAGAADETFADGLIAYLNKVFERRAELNKTIELLGITHTHKDHNLALRKVVENFTVKRYLDNGLLEGSGDTNARWIRDHIAGGHAIPLREITNAAALAVPGRTGLTDAFIDPLHCADCDPVIRVLSGSRAAGELSASALENPNNNSIVWRIDFGHVSLLITGDLEAPAIRKLVADYAGTQTLDVDLYEVGHHGSKNGTTQALLDAMTPTRAIMGVGKWDYGRVPTPGVHPTFNTYAYGHPNVGILRMLEHGVSKTRPAKVIHAGRGARDFVTYSLHEAVYGTGFDGNIVMTAKPDGGLTVKLNQ